MAGRGPVRRLHPSLHDALPISCADRYHFTVGFAASLVSGKLSLLPSTRTPEVVRQLRAFAPDVVCLTDEERSEEHTSELQPPAHLVCRPPLELKQFTCTTRSRH